MSNNKPAIIGLGEILWDMLPSGKQLGGAPANFAYHAGVLGADASIVSSIGNDDLGMEMLDTLKASGLKTDFISTDTARPTGTVSVHLNQEGHPEYTIHEAVAWDYVHFTDQTGVLARKADAVCFGSLAQRVIVSRSTVMSFLENTSKDCLRIFDINLRQQFYNHDIILRSLTLCNVLKLNDEELVLVAGMLDLDGDEKQVLLDILTGFSIDLIALTKGEHGSLLLSQEDESFYRVDPVKVEDTVGAGDSFTAALAMGLLKQRPLAEIHRHAAELSAYVCTCKGATPEVPVHLI